MLSRFGIFVFLFSLCQNSGNAQNASWSLEFKSGVPLNIPLPLAIHQQGYPDIRISAAQYESQPLVFPVYEQFRIGIWNNLSAWEFEVVHHKLFLKNKPAEVESFNISHGYNFLLINRACGISGKYIFRFGVGPVLAHPESVIRGKKFDDSKGIFGTGEYFTGAVLNAAIEKRLEISKRFFISIEGKINPSYAVIPIVNGHAHLWNLAVQVLAGIGYRSKGD